MNKILGYIFYAIGIILILSVFMRITEYIGVFLNLSKLFSSDLEGFGRGEIIGDAIGRLLIVVLIYFLFKWGKKNVSSKNVKGYSSNPMESFLNFGMLFWH